MIQQIKTNRNLNPYLCSDIEDEGIRVEIEEDLDEQKYAIVKVDGYYNGLHLTLTPRSVDFLVAVDCECDSYILYLLELKNVKSPKYLNIKEIHEKFLNTLNDFMTERFGQIFLNDRYKYKDIKLYLVSNAYRQQEQYRDFEQYRQIMDKINKRDSLKTEFSLGKKLFKFRNKVLKINYDIPPNPLISRSL